MFRSNQNNNVFQFKIVLLGDAGTGKTVYINRLLTGEFEKRYLATLGVEVTPLPFYTNKGKIEFSIWDCAGQEKYSGLKDGYYEGADLAIIFFDITNKLSFKNVDQWTKSFRNSCGNKIPIILVGNKVDIRERKVKLRTINNKFINDWYFDISAKSNYNFNEPFLQAAKLLLIDDNTSFVEAPAILPPVVEFVPFQSTFLSHL